MKKDACDNLVKTGQLIYIKRNHLLKTTSNKQWSQSKFITDNQGLLICSRTTLYRIEKNKATISYRVATMLLKKFNEIPFDNTACLTTLTKITKECKTRLELHDFDTMKNTLQKIVSIDTSNEVIISEYKMILTLILRTYVEKICPDQHEVEKNIAMAIILDSTLAYLLIITYWNLCLTDWSHFRLQVILFQYMKRLELNDLHYYSKLASMSYHLNYHFDTFYYTKLVLSQKLEQQNKYIYGSCLCLNFSTIRKLDWHHARSHYSYFEACLDRFAENDVAICQFRMELGLFNAELKNNKLAKKLIMQALQCEPYLAIRYFTFLVKFKFMDTKNLFLIAQNYKESISKENLAVINFYKMIYNKEEAKKICYYFNSDVIPNMENTSYDFESLSKQLRHELIKLVIKTNQYKICTLFDHAVDEIFRVRREFISHEKTLY